MKIIKIRNSSSPFSVVNVKYCDTFLSKLIGFMFSPEREHDYGLLLVEKNENRINSSIHMLFMNFDLTVLWLDKQMVVVDKVLARKWVPVYSPKIPAQYVLELHHSKFSDYSIGDKLIMLNED